MHRRSRQQSCRLQHSSPAQKLRVPEIPSSCQRPASSECSALRVQAWGRAPPLPARPGPLCCAELTACRHTALQRCNRASTAWPSLAPVRRGTEPSGLPADDGTALQGPSSPAEWPATGGSRSGASWSRPTCLAACSGSSSPMATRSVRAAGHQLPISTRSAELS